MNFVDMPFQYIMMTMYSFAKWKIELVISRQATTYTQLLINVTQKCKHGLHQTVYLVLCCVGLVNIKA